MTHKPPYNNADARGFGVRLTKAGESRRCQKNQGTFIISAACCLHKADVRSDYNRPHGDAPREEHPV